jgi:putative endonuclease
MAAAGKIERLWIDAQEWALGRMHGQWARMRRGPATASHLATGLDGERAAYFELKRRGLKVVARRWTNARLRGDVDLIGWDGDMLCFIEVKTRTERDLSPAESAVDEEKRATVRGLARAFLRSLNESERVMARVRWAGPASLRSSRMPSGGSDGIIFAGTMGASSVSNGEEPLHGGFTR